MVEGLNVSETTAMSTNMVILDLREERLVLVLEVTAELNLEVVTLHIGIPMLIELREEITALSLCKVDSIGNGDRSSICRMQMLNHWHALSLLM